MPKKKVYELDDDIVAFLEQNKKRFVNERNIVQTALRDFIKKDAHDRYEKMLKQLNINQHDSDR